MSINYNGLSEQSLIFFSSNQVVMCGGVNTGAEIWLLDLLSPQSVAECQQLEVIMNFTKQENLTTNQSYDP